MCDDYRPQDRELHKHIHCVITVCNDLQPGSFRLEEKAEKSDLCDSPLLCF